LQEWQVAWQSRIGEPIELTVVHVVDDCDQLLATLDDYRSHLVVERPRNPDQLDSPF
jgi:hypothetical protein